MRPEERERAEGQEQKEERAEAAAQDRPQQTDNRVAGNPDDQVIRLHAEEATIGKQRKVTGRVKVTTITRQHEQLLEEMLERDRIEIERVPVGRQVEHTPPVREEGDSLVIPIMEEVVVVERRLVLKEEVHVRRKRETQPYQERVIVRKQEAVITRLPDETNQAAVSAAKAEPL